MRSAIFLCVFLALAVYGQLIIKMRAAVHATASDQQGQWNYLLLMFADFRVLSGLVAGFIAGACWMLAIQKLDIGYAYPFIALTFVIVPVASTYLFGEPLPPLRLVGLALIVAGVMLSALAKL
jgi:drug/metabolite transporter (DMT)-like permease